MVHLSGIRKTISRYTARNVQQECIGKLSLNKYSDQCKTTPNYSRVVGKEEPTLMQRSLQSLHDLPSWISNCRMLQCCATSQ